MISVILTCIGFWFAGSAAFFSAVLKPSDDSLIELAELGCGLTLACGAGFLMLARLA